MKFLTRWGLLVLTTFLLTTKARADIIDTVYTDRGPDGTNWVCVTFKISTAQYPVDHIRLSTDSNSVDGSIGWLCDVSMDSAFYNPDDGTTDGDPANHFKSWNWTKDSLGASAGHSDYWAKLAPPDSNGIIEPQGFAYLTVCMCCGWGHVYMPLTITTYHGSTVNDQFTFNVNWWSRSCIGDGGWQCWEHCDSLTTTYDDDGSKAHEKELCVTVLHRTPGRLYDVTLDFAHDPANPSCTLPTWRLANAPGNWHVASISSSSVHLTSEFTSGAGNCESVTFCFKRKDCAGDCPSMVVHLRTLSDSASCDDSNIVDLTKGTGRDDYCCGLDSYLWHGYSQDMTTGKWTACLIIHRDPSNPDPLTRISIERNGPASVNPRCWQVSNIPWGWKLTSTVGTTDNFEIDGGDTNGCRTFIFCYETCDCQETGGPFQNDFEATDPITSEHFPPSGFLTYTTSDNGTCCGGVWHNKDDVQLTTTVTNCMTWKWLNSHYPASSEGSFCFTIPNGCTPASVGGLPAGWTWSFDPVSHQICIGGDPVPSCTEVDVAVCFDCDISLTPFTSDWTSNSGSGSASWPGASPKLSRTFGGTSSSDALQNFPNPLSRATAFTTTIPFETAQQGTAYLTIFDAAGRVVYSDDEELASAGRHFFYLSAPDLPAGHYYYTIQFPKGIVIVSKTMIIIK